MLQTVLDWVRMHPAFASLILWPLITAVVTLIFHARSPEEYASRSPRVAASFKLLASIGVDTPKAIDGLKLAAGGLTPADRAVGLARVLAAVTIDVPKALEALRQLVTGSAIDPRLLAVGGALMLSVAACTPQGRAAFAELLAKKIACGVAHQDLPPDQMALVCALQSGDIPLVLQAVSEARKASAAAAASAESHAAGTCRQ